MLKKFLFVVVMFANSSLHADIIGIYNNTDYTLKVKDIKTGNYILEELELREKGGTFVKRTLGKTMDEVIELAPSHGVLVDLRYWYKKGFERPELSFTNDTNNQEIIVDLLSDYELVKQGEFELQQDYISATSIGNYSDLKRQFVLSCDKIILISQ